MYEAISGRYKVLETPIRALWKIYVLASDTSKVGSGPSMSHAKPFSFLRTFLLKIAKSARLSFRIKIEVFECIILTTGCTIETLQSDIYRSVPKTAASIFNCVRLDRISKFRILEGIGKSSHILAQL